MHDCRRRDAFLFVVPKTTGAQQLSRSPPVCGESLKRPRADVVSVP